MFSSLDYKKQRVLQTRGATHCRSAPCGNVCKKLSKVITENCMIQTLPQANGKKIMNWGSH